MTTNNKNGRGILVTFGEHTFSFLCEEIDLEYLEGKTPDLRYINLLKRRYLNCVNKHNWPKIDDIGEFVGVEPIYFRL